MPQANISSSIEVLPGFTSSLSEPVGSTPTVLELRRTVVTVTIHNLSANAYLFHILSESLRQRVLQHELLKVSNVLFGLLTDEGLPIMSKTIGVIVNAKPFTSVSSTEIKVVVNLMQPLLKKLQLNEKMVVFKLSQSHIRGCHLYFIYTSMESDKSSFKQKRQAGAAYVPEKNYGLQISTDGYAALKLNEVTSVSQNQLCASDLASSSHS
ncbi:hypothetical protein DY000_02061433 [Brassica cretica]|uniref:Uncharacterized protein n=1 Tax=Brassica cretica TaxID=69181 RepID=A0ABQ7B1I2_BRACR|nr:hypothetical protein DY000_02061433 [Brassica cretica]